MTEFGDPTTAPFWAAAERRELLIQRCTDCGAHQFYPRPFCLSCNGQSLEWVQAAGTGTVHARTTVHLQVLPDMEIAVAHGIGGISNSVGATVVLARD